MTISPWWASYAVLLVGLFLWIWSLLLEAEQRDAETTERERCPMCKAHPCVCFVPIPREAMWRAIQRERGE